VPQATADGRLAGLVRYATAGDRAAARVVLERLMPSLTVRAAGHTTRAGQPFADVLGELVAAAWIVICSYPSDRRPVKVAANLVRDTVGRLYGYRPIVERRTRPCAELPELPAGLDGRPASPTVDTAAAELLEVLADGLDGGVPRAQLRMLAELAVLGVPQANLAARAGISDRAVRLRRDAAVRALRAAVLSPHGAVAAA
jgi:hypothetical protein